MLLLTEALPQTSLLAAGVRLGHSDKQHVTVAQVQQENTRQQRGDAGDTLQPPPDADTWLDGGNANENKTNLPAMWTISSASSRTSYGLVTMVVTESDVCVGSHSSRSELSSVRSL